jgi:DNA-binding MarR family transcriptional regulator
MTDTTPVFDQQLIGQTEKTMNAILDRLLAGSGVSEPEWVTLVLSARGDGIVQYDELRGDVAGALKIDRSTAANQVQGLVGKGLLDRGSTVRLTAAGRQLVDGIRTQTGAITHRLWGDLPAADLEVAGRVLQTVLERAEAELNPGH